MSEKIEYSDISCNRFIFRKEDDVRRVISALEDKHIPFVLNDKTIVVTDKTIVVSDKDIDKVDALLYEMGISYTQN